MHARMWYLFVSFHPQLRVLIILVEWAVLTGLCVCSSSWEFHCGYYLMVDRVLHMVGLFSPTVKTTAFSYVITILVDGNY